MSRSATVIIAWLLKTRTVVSLSEGLEYVETRRPQIQPNPGFIRQLKLYIEDGLPSEVTSPRYIQVNIS